MKSINSIDATLLAAAWSLLMLTSAPGRAQEASSSAGGAAAAEASGRNAGTISVVRSGTQPSRKAPAENFTGAVRIDPLFQASEPARTSAASVTFEPGARSAWHTHPLGQTLIVTAGVGRIQRWGGPREDIRPGDVIWIPPGQKHWHGGAPTTAMTHIAVQEQIAFKNVDWMEKVSDEQYGK